MSSFKRKTTSKQAALPPGTRASPLSSSTVITSTGIPSLDDILGGGLPLSCAQLILAPDAHTAYGELVQKYFLAQGLAVGHRVCVVDHAARAFVGECMWEPGRSTGAPAVIAAPGAEEDENDRNGDDEGDGAKITIAWRYEQMKRFQTTVGSPASSSSSASGSAAADEFCRTFDLTARIPAAYVDGAVAAGRLVCLDVPREEGEGFAVVEVLARIAGVLESKDGSSSGSVPLRICIPSLGSPQWGDLSTKDILYFLHSLRGLLRRHSHACSSTTLPPHLSSEAYGGPGWTQKLGWFSDACVTLSAFSSNPSLSAMFPGHHGLVEVHTVPAPHTLVSASDRFSTLRGLSAAAAAGGGGENNLAFKCTRKRLAFETLHLDAEGGVGERRTTPSANPAAFEVTAAGQSPPDVHSDGGNLGAPAVVVGLEDRRSEEQRSSEQQPVRAKKEKKRVAFRTERPDLYDF